MRLLFSRFAWLVILIFASALPLIGWGFVKAMGTNNNNNIRQRLPADYEATREYREFRSRFGSDEFAVVTWEGCTLDDERLTQFASQLTTDDQSANQQEQLFRRVRTGSGLVKRLTSPPSSIDKQTALERLEGVVISDVFRLWQRPTISAGP